MFRNEKRWPVAVIEGGFVACFALAGCGGMHRAAPGGPPTQGSVAPARAVTAPGPSSPGALKADALDAPAATSVEDARRSAEMAEEMRGAGGHEGHGMHGGGTYVHADAGRETTAREEPSTQAYVCPMHPEVTSTAPGKCPKCGMDLVKRRNG